MATPQDELVDLIERRAAEALGHLDPARRSDTYVVSFFVYDEEDDPRVPMLTIGTNTETQAAAEAPRASSADEARWNYAFWLQDQLDVVGGADDRGAKQLIDQVFTDLGLAWDGEDFSDEALETHDRMTETFVAACVDAARRLHRGITLELFGRDVPVLVHELEYHDEIVEQNRRCNDAALVAEFEAWVLGPW
jgi:hypothetical protein